MKMAVDVEATELRDLAKIDRAFESERHKYYWVRKYFADKRNDRLAYHPRTLLMITRTRSLEDIVKAIHECLSRTRRNYFKSFVWWMGEKMEEEGDWASISYSEIVEREKGTPAK